MTHEREPEAPERLKCPHPTCGHEWEPRKKNPKKCPQCANPLWTSPNPKMKKARTPRAAEVGQTPTAPSEAAAPTPPTTDTSTEASLPVSAGAVDCGTIPDGYTVPSVEEQERQMSAIDKAIREADKLLRRLANAPTD